MLRKSYDKKPQESISEEEKIKKWYLFFYESFNLSQGSPSGQVALFDWVSQRKLISIPPGTPLPQEIRWKMRPPKRHAYESQRGETFEEARETFLSVLIELENDPDTAGILRDFLNNEALPLESIETVFDLLNKDDFEKAELPEAQGGIFDEVLLDIKIQRELLKAWKNLLESLEMQFSREERETSVQLVLNKIIEQDLEFIIKGRANRDHTKIKKADDDNDPYASFFRRYILFKESSPAPEIDRLLKSLRIYWQKNKDSLKKTDNLELLKKLWELEHPGLDFYSKQ